MSTKYVYLVIAEGVDEYEDDTTWVESVHATEKGAQAKIKELSVSQKDEDDDELADNIASYHISCREVEE